MHYPHVSEDVSVLIYFKEFAFRVPVVYSSSGFENESSLKVRTKQHEQTQEVPRVALDVPVFGVDVRVLVE